MHLNILEAVSHYMYSDSLHPKAVESISHNQAAINMSYKY